MSSKLWLRASAIGLVSLALWTAMGAAQDHDHDRDHDRQHERQVVRREAYVDHQREIHEWYRDHHEHLPPGLAKRDRLPPGLERQIVAHGFLPVELRARMQPCRTSWKSCCPPGSRVRALFCRRPPGLGEPGQFPDLR